MELPSTLLRDEDKHFGSPTSTRLCGRPHPPIWITSCCRLNLHTIDGTVVDEGSESWTESYCEEESTRYMRQVVGGGALSTITLQLDPHPPSSYLLLVPGMKRKRDLQARSTYWSIRFPERRTRKIDVGLVVNSTEPGRAYRGLVECLVLAPRFFSVTTSVYASHPRSGPCHYTSLDNVP